MTQHTAEITVDDFGDSLVARERDGNHLVREKSPLGELLSFSYPPHETARKKIAHIQGYHNRNEFSLEALDDCDVKLKPWILVWFIKWGFRKQHHVIETGSCVLFGFPSEDRLWIKNLSKENNELKDEIRFLKENIKALEGEKSLDSEPKRKKDNVK